MRHRRRVARFFSTDDNDDDGDADEIPPRTPRISPVRSELRGDRRVSFLIPLRSPSFLPPLLSLSFILFIELTRKHEVRANFRRIADLSVPGMSDRDYALSLSGKSRTHLRQISISNKNLRTKRQRDVDSTEFMEDSQSRYTRPIATYLAADIHKDLIILSTFCR